MSERIKELAEQAGITTNLDTDYFEKDMNKWVDYFSEKFAELIVYECMEHALEIGRLNPYPQTEMTCRSVADRISIKMLGVCPPNPGPIKAPPRGVE